MNKFYVLKGTYESSLEGVKKVQDVLISPLKFLKNPEVSMIAIEVLKDPNLVAFVQFFIRKNDDSWDLFQVFYKVQKTSFEVISENLFHALLLDATRLNFLEYL